MMAFCKHCGNEVSENEKFCPKCGKELDYGADQEQNLFAPPKYSSTGFTVLENYDLRALARQQLKGVRGKMALAVLVGVAIYLVPSLIASHFIDNSDIATAPIFALIFSIVSLGVGGAFYLGFAGFFLKRIRGEAIAIANIFDGFKRFLPSFLLMFLTGIFIGLWSLLLIVPGIIKSFSYAMSFFILHDNPGMKPLEAIRQSRIMMRRYKAKLFVLYLSFIGWYLLGCLTLGIGFLWIIPYFYLSVANLYENLKQNQLENA
jgi:uncharacterized membrane protein